MSIQGPLVSVNTLWLKLPHKTTHLETKESFWNVIEKKKGKNEENARNRKVTIWQGVFGLTCLACSIIKGALNSTPPWFPWCKVAAEALAAFEFKGWWCWPCIKDRLGLRDLLWETAFCSITVEAFELVLVWLVFELSCEIIGVIQCAKNYFRFKVPLRRIDIF